MIDLERDDYEDEEYDPEVDVLDTWLDPEDPATRPAPGKGREHPSTLADMRMARPCRERGMPMTDCCCG